MWSNRKWALPVAAGAVALIVSAAAVPRGAAAQTDADPDTANESEPRVVRLLHEMGDYLESATEFSFQADITYDTVQSSGRKIQLGGRSEVWVRRPDRIHAEFIGDEHSRRVYYDGDTFTLYDVVRNMYAVTEARSDIDTTLDHVFETYGTSVPIADFLYADPFMVLIERSSDGYVVGRHMVDDTPCHHLAFAQEAIDWQIWIEDGPRPVPRKIVITYKLEPGSPQYEARLSRWNFDPRISEHIFHFDPPEGAGRMEFLPIQETEARP